jgi:branched-chain amino acid transport system permease protein
MRLAVAIFLALAALATQLFAGAFGHDQLAEIGIFAIFAMSLDLLGGYAGLISFGHAGFLGVGAYAFAYFTVVRAWPSSLATVGAILLGVAVALLVGMLVVRIAGVFFIMVTLAVSMMFYSWAFRDPTFHASDGMGGIPRPDLSAIGLQLDDPATFSAFVIVCCTVVWALLELLVASPFGRTIVAIRQNPSRMRALGCPVYRYRLAVFTVSGAIAAFAGCLSAQHAAFISPDIADWLVSGDVLIAVIIGGIGTLVGPILGAAVLLVVKDLLSSHVFYWYSCVGMIFILVALFAPAGICGWLQRHEPAWMTRR